MHPVRKASLGGLLLLCAWLLATAGCVYVPLAGEQFTEEVQAQIRVGESSRAEIEKLLGKPDRLASEHIDIYSLQEGSGTLFLLLLGYYGSRVVPIDLDNVQFRVLLGYDEQGILRRREVQASSDVVPEAGTPGAGITPRLTTDGSLMLQAQARDLLGFRVGIAFDSVHLSIAQRRLVAGGPKLVGGFLSSKRIWVMNLETKEIETFEVGSHDYLNVSPDFSQAVLLNKDATLLDLDTGKPTAVYKGRGKNVQSLASHPFMSLIAAGSGKGLISIWNYSSGQSVREFRAHDGPVWSVVFSSDGRFLATSEWNKATRIWDLESGLEMARMESGGGTLAFSDDGKLLGINRRSHAEVWEMLAPEAAGKPTLRFRLVDAFLLPFAGSEIPNRYATEFADGTHILVASNGALSGYDVCARKEILRLLPAARPGNDMGSGNVLSISSDHTELAVGTDAGVFAWELISEGGVPASGCLD